MSRGAITLRYVLALALVALTVCAGYGAVRWAVARVQMHESAMQVLAEQESHTLEIILYAEAYIEAAGPEEKGAAEAQLVGYLDDLARNHALLLHDSEDSVPLTLETEALDRAYRHPDEGLDAIIKEFQEGVRTLIALEDEQDIDEDHPHARRVLEHLPRKILARINDVVRLHQGHSERRVSRALELGGLSVVAVLIIVVLEAFLIFRPMTQSIAEKQRALEEANVRLERLASFDHLTQVYNRTKFPEISERERGRARREKEPLGCVMLDIDHFKKVNDTHGHATGDTVLQRVAGALMAETRAVDYVIRWGGEEFLVLMPGTNADQTRQAAEKLRGCVAATPVENGLSVTISLGVTTTDGTEPLENVVERADGALYAAKENGRNQVASA